MISRFIHLWDVFTPDSQAKIVISLAILIISAITSASAALFYPGYLLLSAVCGLAVAVIGWIAVDLA